MLETIGKKGVRTEFYEWKKISRGMAKSSSTDLVNFIEYLDKNLSPIIVSIRSEGRQNPSRDEIRIAKEYVSAPVLAQSLWPNDPINKQRVRNLIHRAKSDLENFFLQKARLETQFSRLKSPNIRKDQLPTALYKDDYEWIRANLDLARLALSRGRDKIFLLRWEYTMRILKSVAFKEPIWYDLNIAALEQFNDYCNRFGLEEDLYSDLIHMREKAFILNQLVDYCSMVNRSNLLSKGYPQMQNNILTTVREIEVQKEDLMISTYGHILTALTEKKLSSSISLFQHVKESLAFIPAKRQKQILMYCNNCFQLLKDKGQDSIEAINEYAFRSVELMVEHSTHLVNGNVSDHYFFLIVKIALSYGQADWALNFLVLYSAKVVGKFANEAKRLSECFVAACNGRKNKALEELRNVKFKHYFFQIQARLLILRFWFDDLENRHDVEVEPFLTYCRSFKVFVFRNQQLQSTKKSRIINYISLLELLAKEFNSSGKLSTRIISDFLGLPLEFKEWFLTKKPC